MTRRLPLSVLADLIQQTVESVFYEETFWVIAEITDVKRYEQKRWCFLKFVEKNKSQIATEMQGVFWANAYSEIAQFERKTGQKFTDGIEVSCRVAVRFHPRYGLKLEVQEIDASFTMGLLELQRQQTLDKLLKNYPAQIQVTDGEYHTANKNLQWPKILQRVALIAAHGSDGQRDFMQELLHNQYGYHFELTLFAASVQGQQAVAEVTTQLDEIHQTAPSFDVVAIVRGGGSNTDFAAFDDYEVARRIAVFPIPVFTGIGHDRNTSIADLMAWQFKTPTKVAVAIVDTALRFENDLQELQENIDAIWQSKVADLHTTLGLWNSRMQLLIPHRLQRKKERLQDWQLMLQKTSRDQLGFFAGTLKEKAKRLEQQKNKLLLQKNQELQQLKRMVDQLSPESILNRGFAMVMQDEKLVTDVAQLQKQHPMKTILKNNAIISDIKDIQPHE